MIKGIYDSSRHMLSRQKNIEMVANNLANINTVGYKREVPFSEILTRIDNQPKAQLTDFSNGSLIQTGNSLDLAISGNGFFSVQTPNGVVLTRNGKFEISEDGYIVNEDGYKLLGKQGELSVLNSVLEKEKVLKINKNGEIQIGEEVVGQLFIAKITDQDSMIRGAGTNYLFPDEGYSLSGESEYEISQGYLEESNVNPIIEMQSMISINKDYEVSQKMISSFDTILGRSMEIGRV